MKRDDDNAARQRGGAPSEYPGQLRPPRDANHPPGHQDGTERKREPEPELSHLGPPHLDPPAIDAIFLYETWATAQQADICIGETAQPPKFWSHAYLATRGGWDVSSDRLPYLDTTQIFYVIFFGFDG